MQPKPPTTERRRTSAEQQFLDLRDAKQRGRRFDDDALVSGFGQLDAMSPADILSRALAAYFRTEDAASEQPERGASGLETGANGLEYVVLRNAGGAVCAVYRIRNDGMLKRMKRAPSDLT